MMNNTIILNVTGMNLTNWTTNGFNLRYRCELDGIKMMQTLERTPKEAYYILLVAVVLLLIYILIPNLKEIVPADRIMFPIFMLMLTSLFLYTFTTFNISRELWENQISKWLNIGLLLLVLYIIWNERKGIKEIINKLRSK